MTTGNGSSSSSRTSSWTDTEALTAWAIAGLRLFSRGRRPSLAEIRTEAERVAVVITMPRTGSLQRAATSLKTSRRTLREKLRAMGLYPWKDEHAARFRVDLDSD